MRHHSHFAAWPGKSYSLKGVRRLAGNLSPQMSYWTRVDKNFAENSRTGIDSVPRSLSQTYSVAVASAAALAHQMHCFAATRRRPVLLIPRLKQKHPGCQTTLHSQIVDIGNPVAPGLPTKDQMDQVHPPVLLAETSQTAAPAGEAGCRFHTGSTGFH